jgi:hypothetical protein
MRTDFLRAALVLPAFVLASIPERSARAEDNPGASAPPVGTPAGSVEARSLPFTALLGLEASVVGLSVGPRAELLWRFGAPGTVSRLRTTIGVMPGPEFVFVPIGIGYRAVFREHATVRPFGGAGYEAHFFLTDGPSYAQWAAIYFEGGCGFGLTDRISIGVATSLDWTFAGERGPGLQGRVFGGYQF